MVEVNPNPRIEIDPKPGMKVPPPLDSDYWYMRVVLDKRQAVVCFRAFNVIGIGFQYGRTRHFPASLPAPKIAKWIERDYPDIDQKVVRAAIRELQRELKGVGKGKKGTKP